MTTSREPFPGLTLSEDDTARLRTLLRRKQTERVWRRIRTLELLHDGWSLKSVASALGTYPREVRRVGWRFLEGGVDYALAEEPRPSPTKMLSKEQIAELVAMVCGPPPDGRARWTHQLIADEAMARGVVEKISADTIGRMLHDHDLKPWREKNVVRGGGERGVRREDEGRARHAREGAVEPRTCQVADVLLPVHTRL